MSRRNQEKPALQLKVVPVANPVAELVKEEEVHATREKYR